MRQNDGAANNLVGVLGIHAKIDGEFHGFIELRVMRLLDKLGRVTELVRARFNELARFLHVLSGFFQLCHFDCSPAIFFRPMIRLGFHDFQTHVARRAFDGTDGRVQISGIEIDKLDLRDFCNLLQRDFADFVAVRLG